MEYKAEEVTCGGSPTPVVLTHSVQLGVACTLENGLTYPIGLDLFTECASRSHTVDFLYIDGEEGTYLSCAESVELPAQDDSSTQTVPSVAIETDSIWEEILHTNCVGAYELPVPGAPSPSSPSPPSNPAPAANPTPTGNIPDSNPTTVDAIDKSLENDDGGGSSAGIIAGSLIGVLCLILLVFLGLRVMRRKKKAQSSDKIIYMDETMHNETTNSSEDPHPVPSAVFAAAEDKLASTSDFQAPVSSEGASMTDRSEFI